MPSACSPLLEEGEVLQALHANAVEEQPAGDGGGRQCLESRTARHVNVGRESSGPDSLERQLQRLVGGDTIKGKIRACCVADELGYFVSDDHVNALPLSEASHAVRALAEVAECHICRVKNVKVTKAEPETHLKCS
jgi:hypothetical protein